MRLIDPLAQSFYIDHQKGSFITSVDLYFSTKDDILPVSIELRPMELGFPSQKAIYPFSEVELTPSQVATSDDASIATRVTFPSPIFLEGLKYHAIVLTSKSNNYNVWVSKMGEIDVTNLNSPESTQVVVTKQPISGGLFKSQNSLTWNESPYEDLKFSLNRAVFTSDRGNITFFNPDLSSGNTQQKILSNPLEFNSRLIRVGLGSTVQDSDFKFGNTVFQHGSNATGNYISSSGIATGDLNIINPGIGYTPSSGSETYNNVSLTNITGSGSNGTANITITNGVAVAATILSGGNGYSVGDVLSVSQLGSETLGRNLQLSVSNLYGINELVLDNVQGEFITGAGNTVRFINGSGISTDLNSTVGGNVTILSGGISVVNDGLHIKVNHNNHGMHAGENQVTISDVFTNIKPTKLSSEYSSSSTADIVVPSGETSNFATFENVGVGTTNPGYILLGREIISYEGITSNSLTGITRGIDQTLSFTYSEGTPIYKYELNGISLRRINTTHTLQDATVVDPIGLDYYTIKIDTTQNGKTEDLPYGQVDRSVGTGYPKLYANESMSTGGPIVKASQNIQYEYIVPNIQTMQVAGTFITAEMRTLSGTSVGGQETSFVDLGFLSIELGKPNYFTSPRIVCSKVNETERLSQLPGNKSLTFNLNLSTTDLYLSPVVDLDRTSVQFVTHRVNNPIQNYATDNRVSSILEDPSSFVYVSKDIQLELPATSLKVIVSAFINSSSDLRVSYAIKNSREDTSIYYPFPGYTYSATGIADGTSDNKRIKSEVSTEQNLDSEFVEYEFTVSDLPSFNFYSIKINPYGSNQASPPVLKDLRVIALA